MESTADLLATVVTPHTRGMTMHLSMTLKPSIVIEHQFGTLLEQHGSRTEMSMFTRPEENSELPAANLSKQHKPLSSRLNGLSMGSQIYDQITETPHWRFLWQRPEYSGVLVHPMHVP